MKKTNTKSTFKPAYIVDMTNCETVGDLRMAIIYAKASNNVAVTLDDILFVANRTAVATIKAYNMVSNMMSYITEKLFSYEYKPAKLPWYKRFWNWLTGKKN